MQNTKVSYYRNVQDVAGQLVTLARILEGVRTGNGGKWIPAIEKLRNTQDESERKRCKSELPCFTASGFFTKRSVDGLVAHSGFILLDIDGKDNPALSEQGDRIRQRLVGDKHTAFLFTSCRGKGLAVGVKIDKGRHAESFQALERYYKEVYGLVVDSGCKDVSRLRFVSHDPQIYMNENSEAFIVPETIPEQAQPSCISDASDDDHRIMQAIIASGKPLPGIDDYSSWLDVGFAIANTFGEAGREYFHELSRASSKYDESDCDVKYNNCIRTNKGAFSFATIVHRAKEAGIDLSPKTIQGMLENVNTQTPFDEIKEILKQIARVGFESERLRYIQDLSKRTGIAKGALKGDMKSLSAKVGVNETASENIVVVHPSYEVNDDFMSLGFRETVIEGNTPKDRNMFILFTGSGYDLCEDAIFYRQDGCKVIFDVRGRMLEPVNDNWCKSDVLAFIKKQETPRGIYLKVKQVLKSYTEFQEESHYGLLSAWIIATYFHRCFHAMPFLFVYGKKGCGKSRTLVLVERLSFNAIKTKGITVASLGDTVDGVRGTLLIDQAESLSDPKNLEINGLIADSYTVDGGKRRVVQIVNGVRRVLEFETYSPKAFASIKEIDTDIKDRCIMLTMVRASREYPEPDAHLPIWKTLRGELYKLLLTRWKDVREIYQTTGEGVSHRVRELWRPIETILKLEEVPQKEMQDIKQAFLDSMQETQTNLSDYELELIDTLLEMISESGKHIFTSDEIAARLCRDEGMSIKAKQIWTGKTLGLLKLYTQKLPRSNNKTPYLFDINHVKNTKNKYMAQTSGFYGSIAGGQQNQGNPGCHRENPLSQPMAVSQTITPSELIPYAIPCHRDAIGQKSYGMSEVPTGAVVTEAMPYMPLKIHTSEEKNSEPIKSVEKLNTETESIPELEFIEEVASV
ncbi:MAG: hypothetical protein E3K36_04340 [Candidatus Brocadia sp.]|nr:hypothetical protein [Candidatus Brocadia sp.]